MAIKGSEIKRLCEALVDAYDIDRLAMLVLFERDVPLANIVDVAKPFDLVVFQLVMLSRAQGWLQILIQAAIDDTPGNADLRSAHNEIFAATPPLVEPAPASSELLPRGQGLERIVDPFGDFLNPDDLVVQLLKNAARVCRIEIDGSAIGTGFLVGPDLIVTNYHVMEDVIKGSKTPGSVRLRFDYKVVKGAIENGITFGLANDWLLDSAPPSESDEHVDPPVPPSPDELDFAVLRLDGKPGEGNRGWIVPNGTEPKFLANMTLYILQHPDREPIKLAAKLPAKVALNANRTRVRYDVNTLGGSSGSPVFDSNWNLLALHHAGDPNRAQAAAFNQGVPFWLIDRRMKAKGIQ